MSDRAEKKIEELTRQIERLSLVSQAMWELLRDRSELTDDELASRIVEVDLRDGKWDGKKGPEIVECPTCGRSTNALRGTCLFCGSPVPRQSMF